MAALIASSHIVCLPSYREGLPKSLLEAAAAGRPMVATDVPGCREVVLPGVTGLLVQPRDAEQLAAALERLISDPAMRERMGHSARLLCEEEFGVDQIVKRTLDLYHA
jgi:glycosyltransferase involved in cell wall biosynthesis